MISDYAGIPSSSELDMDNALPEGWCSAKLGEGLITNVQSGFACGKHNNSIGIPHLRPMNVNSDGRIDLTDVKYVPEAFVRGDQYLLRRGDVLFNNTNSPALVGKTAYYDSYDPRAFSNHMTRLRSNPSVIEPKYCAMALHQLWRDGLFSGICNNHVSQASVGRDVLLGISITLPPLAEQARIVTKVEELLAQLNAVRARLAKVPGILKRFRQSVLAAACSGRLTEDWRERNEDVESASRILARVREDKFSASGAGTINTKSGRSGSTNRPVHSAHGDVDYSGLPSVPNPWTWVFLSELGELNRGKSKHRPRDAPHLFGGPYPFIQTGDVAQSGGRITSHRQSYSEAGLAQSRLWPAGTICITIAANIAFSAILSYPACFPDSLVGIIPDPRLCAKEYVEFFLRTAREDLAQFAPATAQKNINVEILNELAVPLPPLSEQHEIVRRVEALFKLAEAIEERVTAATLRTEKLTQAILAKAFRGELVPTEAELARQEGREYEPAWVLLERVRREREQKARPVETGRTLRKHMSAQ